VCVCVSMCRAAFDAPHAFGPGAQFSVFSSEILSSPEKACQITKQALNEAINHLGGIGEKEYKDATFIMQHLRDNLTLWISDTQEGDDDEGQEIFTARPMDLE
jgi:14-3-3 protein epsilon